MTLLLLLYIRKDLERVFMYRNFTILLLTLVLSGCFWGEKKRLSILVIAIEYLGFNSFSCSTSEEQSDRDFSGFATFCEESVRFTHAFTPSVMSQASLASIMTARYPFEHGVWHNGSQYLSSHFKTVAEFAIEKGYRTSFFSGGPPIWRKSGLSQGFEVFEDNVKPSLIHPHRPVLKNIKEFLHWWQRVALNRPFFSVLYIPDLQFSEIATTNNAGEVRERTSTGQLKEIDESLSYLIKTLKNAGHWDQTTIFLVGLNARPKISRPGELETFSLYSDATQVALYIKPARKSRDLGLEWKIDKNVTLVDVGATLYDLLGVERSLLPKKNLEITSLKDVLEKPEVSWNQDRILMLESGWPQWRGISGSRFSLRKGYYFVLYDEQPKIFNTLIDRQEISPLSQKNPLYQFLQKDTLNYLQNNGFLPWVRLPSHLVEKLEVAKDIWSLSGRRKEEEVRQRLLLLSKRRSWDPQILGWKAIIALEEKNWKWLRSLGKNEKQNLWEYVAERNLGNKRHLSDRGCKAVFHYGTKYFKKSSRQECEDDLLLSLLKWVEAKDEKRRAEAQIKFLRKYIQEKIEQRIGQWNFVNGLNWDVDVNIPHEPLLADLFLALPQNARYASIIELKVSRKTSGTNFK